MGLSEEQVIERLCGLATLVGGKKFNHELPHDCFCQCNEVHGCGFQFDEQIIKFIEAAVLKELNE